MHNKEKDIDIIDKKLLLININNLKDSTNLCIYSHTSPGIQLEQC